MPDSIGYTIIKQAHFDCPWCTKAIEALDARGLPYSIRTLTKSQLLEEAAHAKMSSIPIIYHGVRLVGGYTELVIYLDNEAPDVLKRNLDTA
jgi:glutaredoxin